MKRGFKQLLSIVLSLSILEAPAFGKIVQIKIGDKAGLRAMDSRGLLAPETALPPGAVIELDTESYKNAKKHRYWSKSDEEAVAEFVLGVRVISAPGRSASDIAEINAWTKTQKIYVAKQQIADAEVVAIKEKTQTVVTQQPVDIYRTGDDPWKKRGSSGGPIDGVDARNVVDQATQLNQAVQNRGRSFGSLCSGENYAKIVSQLGANGERSLRQALERIQKDGRITNRKFLAIADLTKPGNQRRLAIINLQTGKVDQHFTSHGENNGPRARAVRFSGKFGSHQTPAGFHVTKLFASSNHGMSLKMHGLEERNKLSGNPRGILLHEAWYASEKFVKANGTPLQSHGCLTIDPKYIAGALRDLGNGALIYNYVGE